RYISETDIYNSMEKGEFIFNLEDEVAGEGFLIIGVSGGGKSRSLSRLLAMYPQVIKHSEYQNQLFLRVQVVYLKIDCPHDGTLKGLAGVFFKELDKIIGSEYARKYENRKYSVSQLMLAMENLIVLYGIGVLIVDEIQHLSVAKSQGEEMMLNFFVTLSNCCKIPIIFVGTPKTEKLFSSALRQTRRMCGQGDLTWKRFEKDSREWELFVNSIWDYQWTKQETELTTELKDVFYEGCQGIIAIAVKLFILTQIETMKKKKEIITPAMFNKASKNHLGALKPIISALKSGNESEMRNYDDILIEFIHNDSNTAIDQEINQINLDLLEKQSKEIRQKQDRFDEVQFIILNKLKELNIDYKVAKKAISKVIKENPEQQNNTNFLMQETLLVALTLNKHEQVQNQNSIETVEKEVVELLVSHEEDPIISPNSITTKTKLQENKLDLRDTNINESDAYNKLRAKKYIKDIQGDIL
ncbi:AAA family ATPase, partial [Bacillus paranthracis]|uniref:ATP-binding protein n=1 Tax=Bacillus paranthracis TaxID=2026186 RepID=UPI00240D2741